MNNSAKENLLLENEGRSVINFTTTSTSYDASRLPVLIVGQIGHIRVLPWQYVSTKFGIVTEQMWRNGVDRLSPMDTISLYLNSAYVAALPSKCSRHNSPSQARALAKIIRSFISHTAPEQAIIVACPYEYVLSSANAIARTLPIFNAKTSLHKEQKVNVEFFVFGSGGCADPIDIIELTDADIECIRATCSGVRLAAEIVDMPCNIMNTDAFIQKIQYIGKSLGIVPKIVRGKQLEDEGFGGIYGVGKAAKHEPALVSLSYIPVQNELTSQYEPISIALVGKGIVFDTGGLCIKTKTGMPGMKRDCGGAAAILGAFYAAIKSGFGAKLHAVFCLAENAVGPDATRPDDVHRLYSGKTVEVNNTDAEGRLVLADGVVYAQRDLGANIILDMATLTGAQAIATGKYHGALLSNDEHWEHLTVSAGLRSGEMVHPVPYSPELHFSEFSSAVADMKNSVADRSNAQPSCAGLFIGAHLGFDFPGAWIHIDMAAPVCCGERATGYGVGLIVTLFGMYSTHRMLQYIAPTLPDQQQTINDTQYKILVPQTQQGAAAGDGGDMPSKKLRTQ